MKDTRRTRLLLALLLVTSFTLLTVDYRSDGSSPLSGVRTAAATVFGPFERAAAAVVDPVRGALSALTGIGSDQDRIDELTKENAKLRQQVRTGDLARSRAAELDKLLETASLGQYKVVPAQVVAIGPAQGFAWTVTIDAGSRDGIKADETVLSGDGLVGRVKSVGPFTATVLLAIDEESAVGARLEGNLEVGIVSGRARGLMDLALLDPQAKVAAGDRVVTYGSRASNPFVPGVPIGEVVSVRAASGLTRDATVRPYVDFTALDLVGVVVVPPRRDPRDAVLPAPTPPRPTPRVTVTVTAPPAKG
jgi:rod shape-determining protein MreC